MVRVLAGFYCSLVGTFMFLRYSCVVIFPRGCILAFKSWMYRFIVINNLCHSYIAWLYAHGSDVNVANLPLSVIVGKFCKKGSCV